jgi:hypothetical protein
MKTLSLLVSIPLFLFSCSKDSQPNPNITDNGSPINRETFYLSNEQLEFIGEKHNDYLLFMLEDNDLENYTLGESDLLYASMNSLSDQFGDYIFSSSSFPRDLDTIMGELFNTLSDDGDSLLLLVLDKVLQIEQVDTFEIQLNEIVENAKEYLSSEDYNIIATVAVVLNYSSKFWAPVELGGNGIGYASLEQRHGILVNSRAFNWRNALISDGTSAGVGCLGVAVLGALGPVGWVALATVAGEAAVNSGIAGWL